MAKYGMVFDLDKCIGCHACVMACRAEWELPADKSRCWVKPIGPENTPYGLASTFYIGLCNQCEEPSCVKECPTTATYKADNGAVLVNKELCIGCGNCIIACPYGARYINEIDKKVDKCTFCEGRIQRGEQPACVKTCPTNARIFGDLENKNSAVYKKVYEEGAVPIATARVNLHPNVFYLGKERDIHLIADSYAPAKNDVSISNQLWRIFSPLVVGGASASIIAAFIAFANQIRKGEQTEEDE
ncbi:MAG: 4Fe-4S dicluster domain-containing protein [Nitrospirae bacterium]|nr:4Fe-4S dicluster domain-containing protein [Nitrospirota bacterium]